VHDELFFTKGDGIFGGGGAVDKGGEGVSERMVQMGGEGLHEGWLVRGGDEVYHKFVGVSGIADDEVTEFAGVGVGGVDGEFISVLESEFTGEVEYLIHFGGGEVAVIDINRFRKSSGGVEAEGEVDRFL